MKQRVLFSFFYLAFWIAYFIVAKFVFLLYHYSLTSVLDFPTLAFIFIKGFKLDISFAGYISLLPFLVIATSAYVPNRITSNILKIFTLAVLCVVTFMVTVDLELYRAWHFRLDVTPLMYINTPQEMVASAAASPILVLLMIFALLLGGAIFICIKFLFPYIASFQKSNFITVGLIFILAVSLIIPIRGGFQLAPVNQSSVYFSSSDFANHAAINAMWNFSNSLVNRTYEKINPYTYFDAEEAVSKVQSLYPVSQQATPSKYLLNTPNPNVLVIIWESLTAKVIEPLGGLTGITPQFSRLSKEGVLFTNIYASGNRSDKGIVAILSAFPAQPKNSIITIPNKTAHLPYISADLKKKGYHTGFYYGGELEFANIKSYLLKGSFEKVIGKEAFNQEDWNSKWGAHDHVVYEKLLSDLNQTPQPFFHTMFTLSSHEPFEVPVATAIPGEDEQSLFLNAMHYSDESLGNFIEAAKKQSWWNNTLVIVIADHGHRLPELNTDDKSQEFHIPMLWLGGALKEKGIIIDQVSSQTDLVPTLLSQLNMPYQHYKWGHDIFHPSAKPFAYYVFNDGFGLIQPGKQVVFDNVGKRVLMHTTDSYEEDIALGKSYLQISYQDYLDK
ncbi:sulfatase-like hydrolase/transferase [Rhodocytophaga rosea]|uniref:Sulfatase-like hydrolase/transferase n=1 Tax=Rhodocytophaga rosea TaxID=2704465 RepID=A0A6C0GG72_9BACT|nr:alkaline phosphatase family protein [Rhodocytophaga rosea]QHT66875.1 sulfatase-like hydrolase/transferase [Rhodocytophaga rosea]